MFHRSSFLVLLALISTGISARPEVAKPDIVARKQARPDDINYKCTIIKSSASVVARAMATALAGLDSAIEKREPVDELKAEVKRNAEEVSELYKKFAEAVDAVQG